MQLTPSLLLQDPEAGNEATGELLARQFGLLGSCLEDQAPAVRAGAVQGTCVLLHRFWELVPAGTSASFLNRLAGVCSAMRKGRFCWRASLQKLRGSVVSAKHEAFC